MLSVNSPTSRSSQKSVVEIKAKTICLLETDRKICDTNSSNSSESLSRPVSSSSRGKTGPVNMLDLIQTCFGYSQLWPLQPAYSQKQARSWFVYAWSNFPHPIQFCFSKEGMDHSVQNRPWSDMDGLVRVWPNASGLKQASVQKS